LRDTDGDSFPDPLCGGNDCNDANPMVWLAPAEVTNLNLTNASPADPAWDSQAASAGPETIYDLVSGSITALGNVGLGSASCLQPGGANSYSDPRPDPALDQALWYLARARNSCGTGTWGSTQRDTSIPACP
jgi:hypothetical protein